MGFAPTWLRQVSPLLHKTTLTTAAGRWAQHRSSGAVVTVQRVRRRLQNIQTYLLTYRQTHDDGQYAAMFQ